MRRPGGMGRRSGLRRSREVRADRLALEEGFRAFGVGEARGGGWVAIEIGIVYWVDDEGQALDSGRG